MDKELILNTLKTFFASVAAVMLLIFLPAGTVGFENGWIVMGLIFIPLVIVICLLLVNDPGFLRARFEYAQLKAFKKTPVLIICGVVLIGFVLTGLTYRFGWMPVPGWAVVTASVFFLAGYGAIGEVYRENVWLIRENDVSDDQDIYDTGLYGIIRHPMYAACIIMFPAMFLALGSFIAFIVTLILMPAAVVYRIIVEEKAILEVLPGYKDYSDLVRFRLIPFVW